MIASLHWLRERLYFVIPGNSGSNTSSRSLFCNGAGMPKPVLPTPHQRAALTARSVSWSDENVSGRT